MAMMTPRLAAYLELERQMLALDAITDPVADVLRDAMDSVWYGLSDKEHALLNNRTVLFPASSVLPVGESLYEAVPEQPLTTLRPGPIFVTDWECAVA